MSTKKYLVFQSKEIEKMVVSESNSSLPLAVQQLVALFFDVDTMKSQMMEFEVSYLCFCLQRWR